MGIVKCGNHNEVCVQDRQGSISFERILNATSVPSAVNAYPRLTVPAWFVRQHGDKLRLSVVLQFEATREKWTVQVVVRHPHKHPQVMFYGGGWKVFATFNGLVEGDRLIFTLTAMSEFEVCISDNAGELAVPWPRKPRSKRTRFSQRLIDGSPGHKIENVTVKKPESNAIPGLGKLCSKCTPEEEVADSASNGAIARNLSFSKLPLVKRVAQVSPLKSCYGSDICTEPGLTVVYQQELLTSSFNRSSSPSWNSIERKRNHAHEYRDDVPRKKLQTSLPSFVKQLPVKHAQRMEIPRDFLRTYGDRLYTAVKLQGIHDRSPVRSVACSLRNDRKFFRLDLTDGWREFDTENCLEAGQKFVFTLASDSFFEVRRVHS